MRRSSRASFATISIVLSGSVAFAIVSLLSAVLFAADNYGAPAISAYVYVGSFDAAGNNYVYAYAVVPDGSAEPIPSSPFSLPSFGLVSAGNFLIGENGKNIAAYNIAADGTLQESSMVNGLAYIVDPGDQMVYALNVDHTGRTMNSVASCGSCNSEISPWVIASNGQLSYIAEPGLGGGPAKWQGVMTFSPDNRYVYSPIAQDFGIWRRNTEGTLTAIKPGEVYAPPLGSLNQQVCIINTVATSAQGYITLGWYGGGQGCNLDGYILGNYTVASNGALQLVQGSGITPQVREKAMAYDTTGTYLAIAGGGIQVLKLRADGRLVPLGAFGQAPGLEYVLWDNSNHLYALSEQASLYIFNFDGQNLSLAPGSPYPIQNAVSLAVVPQP